MATFRKYGGTNYSPIANIVRHNIFNSKSSSFITSGLYNSKETFLSHIDMSGNSLLHVGNLYFQDGTSISSGTSVNVPTLSQVLNKGNSANSNAILDLSYILFKDGSILNTATGITPTLASVLNNGNSAGDYDINMNGHSITNISSIEINGLTQNSTYTGFNTSGTYNSATLTFDTNGKIINVIDNSLSPFGLSEVLTNSEDGGGKSITGVKDITATNLIQSIDISATNVSASNSINSKNIFFTGSLTQTNSNTNTLNPTVFSDICSYSPSSTLNFNNDLQIPTIGYVNSVASGLSPTTLCDCATTQNISFSGVTVPTIIDGVTLSNGDRVLVKCQDSSNNVSSSNINNGIYVYTYDTSGSFSRASDCSGNDVVSQLTFISDGSLNGMKAFVQINSPAIAGTQPLNYVPFYSLNYNLGQGLDLSGGSTLQVKSNLDFLTKVTIKNNNILNPALQIFNTSETKRINILCDLSNDNYNSITEDGDNGIISGGIDASGTCPLVLTTWRSGPIPNGIRITENSVVLKADTTNYYDLSTSGHNFYGNLIMSSDLSVNRQIYTGYLNLANVNSTPQSAGTQIYQSGASSFWDNNIDGGNLTIAMNTLGGLQVIPMTLSSTFVDCNLPFRINTIGSYLQFPDGTQQTTAYDSSSNISYEPGTPFLILTRLPTTIINANFGSANYTNVNGFNTSIYSIHLTSGKYLLTYKYSISQQNGEQVLQCAGILVDSPSNLTNSSSNQFIIGSDSYCTRSEGLVMSNGTTFSFGTSILYNTPINTHIFLKYGIYWTSSSNYRGQIENGYISYIKL